MFCKILETEKLPRRKSSYFNLNLKKYYRHDELLCKLKKKNHCSKIFYNSLSKYIHNNSKKIINEKFSLPFGSVLKKQELRLFENKNKNIYKNSIPNKNDFEKKHEIFLLEHNYYSNKFAKKLNPKSPLKELIFFITKKSSLYRQIAYFSTILEINSLNIDKFKMSYRNCLKANSNNLYQVLANIDNFVK